MTTRRGLAAAMAAGGCGVRRNAGGERNGGGRTKAEAKRVMKFSELVLRAKAIMGLFGW
jgi:hypothetical protein